MKIKEINIKTSLDVHKITAIIDTITSGSTYEKQLLLRVLDTHEVLEVAGILKNHLPEHYIGLIKRKHIQILKTVN